MSDRRLAVVGATGAVGRTLLLVLEERDFPMAELRLMASARSAGSKVTTRWGEIEIEDLESADANGVDIAIFSAGAERSRIYARRFASAGAVVVDNSSAFRRDPAVPLVVAGVNDHAVSAHQGIISNPNCTTMALMVAAGPLHRAAGIERMVATSYQSVSGSGKAGMDELFEQSRNIFVGDSNEPQIYPKQIAFNVIPQAGDFLEDGSTTEEWKLVVETKKILDPAIKVSATCVRVPVFVSHSEAVNVEFENEISADEARNILREAPGVMVVDKREPGGYVTPVEAVGEYATYVSRIREDPTVDNGLSLWVVSDNLRKGAALNAVQIAELLGRKHLQKAA